MTASTHLGRGGKFNPNAAYLAVATPFERIQLEAMAKIIEAKTAELRDLRVERHRLAVRIQNRWYDRREGGTR